MIRLALAAAAAFALASAAPALACGEDCPMHKAKVAAADKAEKKDEKVACACHEGKPCACEKGKCECSHDHHDHGTTEKKGEEKKS